MDRNGVSKGREPRFANSGIGGHNDVDNPTSHRCGQAPRGRPRLRPDPFASVLLVVAGFFNMIYGIAAIANSHVFFIPAYPFWAPAITASGRTASTPRTTAPRADAAAAARRAASAPGAPSTATAAASGARAAGRS